VKPRWKLKGKISQWPRAIAITGPVYRAAQYSPAGRRASGGASVVKESKDKVEETKGNSLKQKKKL